MKLGEAELQLRQQLQTIYENREAAAIASMILEHITAKNRLDRMVQKDGSLTAEQEAQLTAATHRLLQHEPVQYVLNKAHFAGMELYVNNHVLIPRPETEELVEWIVRDIEQQGVDVFEKGTNEADATRSLKILDVGTGSGCIALALKKKLPKAEVWGCDNSDNALTVARRNSSYLDVRVDFVGLDFLDRAQQQQLPMVDIIVSNPPYVPLKDKESMQPNVVQYEPHLALFVPDNDALIFYKTLAHFARRRLHSGGYLYAELHEALGNEVAALFQGEGFTAIEVKKDMQGKNRMIKAGGLLSS